MERLLKGIKLQYRQDLLQMKLSERTAAATSRKGLEIDNVDYVDYIKNMCYVRLGNDLR